MRKRRVKTKIRGQQWHKEKQHKLLNHTSNLGWKSWKHWGKKSASFNVDFNAFIPGIDI